MEKVDEQLFDDFFFEQFVDDVFSYESRFVYRTSFEKGLLNVKKKKTHLILCPPHNVVIYNRTTPMGGSEPLRHGSYNNYQNIDAVKFYERHFLLSHPVPLAKRIINR